MDKIVFIDGETGKKVVETPPSSKMLKYLYNKPFGRLSLNILFKRKLVSSVGGLYMNSKRSSKRVLPFVDNHKMDLSDYVVPESGFRSFNQFFYRELKENTRPIQEGLVSPADGKALVFNEINDSTRFFVKGSLFSVAEFLGSNELGKKYEGGGLVIVRLAPTDYHRYHFPTEGIAGPSIKIRGHYFSVSPLALQRNLAIFLQNKREYTLLKNEELGDIVVCDVGATMVGSINQTYTYDGKVEKGQEKGYFAFGGSTIVLLTEKGKVKFKDELIQNTLNGFETTVKMGETLGWANH